MLTTHDAATMTVSAYTRIAAGEECPGVIVIPQWLPVGVVLEDLVLVVECSLPDDWLGQVRFLPLK